MVRLNMPKRQKNTRKRGMMSMSGQLSGITHFSDITALTGGDGGQVRARTVPAEVELRVAPRSNTYIFYWCRMEGTVVPRKRRNS